MIDPAKLYERYSLLKNIHKSALEFGISGETGRQILIRAGLRLFNSDWTEEEKEILTDFYRTTLPEQFDAQILADKLKRTKAAVYLMASELGVSNTREEKRPWREDARRKISEHGKRRFNQYPELRKATSERARHWHANNDHPRGFSGHKHSPESLAKISAKSSAWHQSQTKAARRSLAIARQKKAIKNGNPLAPRIGRGSWKSAWVEIGGKRFFSRSGWEAAYARFLQWQKEQCLITDWEYEPTTFWFPVKRGTTNYTPDFRVFFADGRQEYHEVKGWMDPRSRTKFKRMRIYHPRVIVRLIDAGWFKANKSFLQKT